MDNYIGSPAMRIKLKAIEEVLNTALDGELLSYDTQYVNWARKELAAINDRVSAEINGDPDQPARDSNGIMDNEGC